MASGRSGRRVLHGWKARTKAWVRHQRLIGRARQSGRSRGSERHGGEIAARRIGGKRSSGNTKERQPSWQAAVRVHAVRAHARVRERRSGRMQRLCRRDWCHSASTRSMSSLACCLSPPLLQQPRGRGHHPALSRAHRAHHPPHLPRHGLPLSHRHPRGAPQCSFPSLERCCDE